MKCWEMKSTILFSLLVILHKFLQRFDMWPCIQNPKHPFISKLLFPDSSESKMSQTFFVSLILQLNGNLPLSLNFNRCLKKTPRLVLRTLPSTRGWKESGWASPHWLCCAPVFRADTADSAEMIKGSGESVRSRA